MPDEPTYRRNSIRRKPGDVENTAYDANYMAYRDDPVTPSGAAPLPTVPPRSEHEGGRSRLDAEALLDEIAGLDAATFAAMMSRGAGLDPEPGEAVSGTVVRVSRDAVFVDIAAKAEALIERAEVPDAVVGQPLTAFVAAVRGGVIRLTRKVSGDASAEMLRQAMESRSPLEGRIERRNPGGFDVRIGDVKAFCPVSQVALRPAAELDVYVGQTFRWLVTGLRDGDVVVSRRDLERAEVELSASRLWSSLKVGSRRKGAVTGVHHYGAFVDVGGVSGLVHVSEYGEEAPQDGQQVEVRILEVDLSRKRLSLSLKDGASHSDAPQRGAGQLGTLGDLFGNIKIKG